MKKKRQLFNQSILLLLVSCLFFSACSSTTMIRSTDPNARIYVDSEFKGTGNVTHADQKVVGTSTHVKIERPGCQSEHYVFTRNEEFDFGACVGGVFLLLPFLWIMKYKPEHFYEYRCKTLQPRDAQPWPTTNATPAH